MKIQSFGVLCSSIKSQLIEIYKITIFCLKLYLGVHMKQKKNFQLLQYR